MAIIDIFSKAIELSDTDERLAFVERSCGDDASARHQLMQMLEQYYDPATFMKEPAIDAAPLDSETGSNTLPSEKPGDRIGRYKLLEKIGEGGMGLIYMAEQQEPVVRRVALKIIKWGMDTKQVLARFEAERQALALMNHPNIAKILDAGSTETGRSYFVMELVQGLPITDYCDEYNLNTNERLEIFSQVCNAVHHAHQKGIIHRDIKPSNVLVTRIDDLAVPKVIDFGIAKATQQRLTEKTLFTQFQQFIGTPAYMSPEQAQIGALDIDTRSDIYSLGVLLYELLTGRTPFTHKELMSGGYEEIRRRVRESHPIVPSKKLNSLTQRERTDVAKLRRTEATILDKTLQGELDWIIMKSLEKDRTRRYETANSFRLDIDRHLKNEPVSAAAPSPIYLVQKFATRHRTPLASAALILILLVTATIVSLTGWREAGNVVKQLENANQTLQEKQEHLIQSNKEAEINAYDGAMALVNRHIREGDPTQARTMLQDTIPSKMRGFAWRLQNQRARPQFNELTMKQSAITHMGISPNGKRLAIVDSLDISLWDFESNTNTPLETKQQILQDRVKFITDETLSVVTYFRGYRTIDLRTKQNIKSEQNRVIFNEFDSSPWITIRREDRNGFLNLKNGEFIHPTVALPDHNPGEVPLLASVSDQYILTGKFQQNTATTTGMTILDATTQAPLLEIPRINRAMDFHPKQELLAVSLFDESAVAIYDLSNRQLLKRFPIESRVMAINFSHDGRSLTFTTELPQLFLWNLDQETPHALGMLPMLARSAIFTTDDQAVIVGDADGRITVWPTEDENLDFWQTEQSAPNAAVSYAHSADGSQLAIGPTAANEIRLYSLPGLIPTKTLVQAGYPLAFLNEGQQLLTATEKALIIWNIKDESALRTVPLNPQIRTFGLEPTISPDRDKIAITDQDKTIRIYQVSNGTLLHTLDTDGHTGWSKSSYGRNTFSPDGLHLAFAHRRSLNQKVFLYDLKDQETRMIVDGTKELHSTALSPTDDRLAVCGFRGVSIHDLTQGRATTLPRSINNNSITFSPGGELLCIAREHDIQILNATTYRELISIPADEGLFVNSTYIDPTQNYLVGIARPRGFQDNHIQIRVWPAFNQSEAPQSEQP